MKLPRGRRAPGNSPREKRPPSAAKPRLQTPPILFPVRFRYRTYNLQTIRPRHYINTAASVVYSRVPLPLLKKFDNYKLYQLS